MQNYEKRWEIIKELGKGAQGKVFLIRDIKKFKSTNALSNAILQAVEEMARVSRTPDSRQGSAKRLRNTILDIVQVETPENCCALKVLHKSEDARDPNLANERIVREMRAMSEVSHANLLKIIDSDPDEQWFVSQYHPNGTLLEQLNMFKGNFAAALKAFRPLVAGVAELHRHEIVHRDIKPENIFLASDGNLILGDFGLVFFTDNNHTRISATLENVGSRDWMPPWASGCRVEDIRPSFDVHTLGKVLWSMTSGASFLRLWYFDRDDYNVEKNFPRDPSIRYANRLFGKCIVENEDDCLQDAHGLLEEIDKILMLINKQSDVMADDIQRPCRVCGIGFYEIYANRNQSKILNFGLHPRGNSSFKIFSCTNCRHIQMFSCSQDKDPPGWNEHVNH